MERIEKETISKINLYLGPMSKNIVEAIIDYNTNVNNAVGIVASRRQVDFHAGYVNNWLTPSFVKYIKGRNPNIIVCRDHGGPNQGSIVDDGTFSLKIDAEHMDVIHIDPFKTLSLNEGIYYTIDVMSQCLNINENSLFEIGTEQSIFPMTPAALDFFLYTIQSKNSNLLSKIVYAVIQSGTSLQSGINTGEFDKTKLSSMIDVCKRYRVLSKEHNGDYQTPIQIRDKFKMGLSAINIAPEIAHIETEYIIENISKKSLDKWFQLTIDNRSWHKWFPEDFNPYSDKKKVVRLCGHYVFTNPEFIGIFNLQDASEYVTNEIYKFINERV